MHRNHRVANITRAIAGVAIIAAFSGAGAEPACAGNTTVVKLELDEIGSGITRIRVNPRDAKIWRGEPGKAQKIRWWMVKNRTSYSQILWEFRYAASREGATADYFGDVDLECGKTEVEVPPEMLPESAEAAWPYSITAYACADGVKGQKIATIDTVRVVWKD